jgi:hypothetical protein
MKPRPDRQGWPDVDVALNGSLSDSIHGVRPAAKRGDYVGIGPGPRRGSEVAADAEQRRQERGLELSAPVIVDLILKTGIGAGLALKYDMIRRIQTSGTCDWPNAT